MLTRGSRGRFRPRLSSSSLGVRPEGFSTPPRQEESFEASTITTRRLPASPIYVGAGPYAQRIPRAPQPKLLRDALYDRMCDWEFHGLEDFDSWLPQNQWITAMCDLVVRGFTFDRRGMMLRLRKRDFYEKKPVIVGLLSGLTLPLPEQFAKPTEEEQEEERAIFDFGLPDEKPEPGDEMRLGEEDQLVLSAPDMVSEAVGILARRGEGKTYLAMVMAEEFMASRHNIPFVVLDPTGAWWGLGFTAEGDPMPNGPVVFGGKHGHYPLASSEGVKLARVVVDLRPLRVILDVSKMSNEEQHEFGADFATELYRRNSLPLHVFIDEAHTFVPQKLDRNSAHQRRSLNAMSILVRQGRLRGIGATVISQRPAVVNKDVLSQVGVMFFLRVSAPHDQNAIETWLQGNVRNDVCRACLAALKKLGQGTAYFLQGGEDSRFCKFKVRTKRTYDSSREEKMGKTRRAIPVMEVADSLRKEIAESFAKAEAFEEDEVVGKPKQSSTALAVVPRELEGQEVSKPALLGDQAKSVVTGRDAGDDDDDDLEDDREPEFDTRVDEEP
jgi:hypothetical protein